MNDYIGKDRRPRYRKKRPGPCCAFCDMSHASSAGARRHYFSIIRRWRKEEGDLPPSRTRRRRKSCRRPGEYKPGGGRYEKKTCVPRKKSRRRHRAGQFKPGGGRYVTTSGGRKTKKRKGAVRGTAEMSIF